MVFLISAWLLLQGANVPYKAKEEFAVNIDLQFKNRPGTSTNPYSTVDLTKAAGENQRQNTDGPLSFLTLKISLLKLSGEEVSVKVVDAFGKAVYHRKAKVGDLIKLKMGFVDDIKNRIATHEYNVFLLSPEKNPVTRIHIFVEKDGTYWVNKVQYGKF